jgi:hypothetical protein
MINFDFPQLCTKCQGYKTMPYTWSSTVTAKMCTCISPTTLAWECPRCHKVNAPFKNSCNCLPFNPMGGQPSKYLGDEIGQFNITHK